jgi:Uma2 family endonuclease
MPIDPQEWEAPHPGRPMSVEEYLLLDANAGNARYEYIDDEAQMMSDGSREHDRIAFNTRLELYQHFLSEEQCAISGGHLKVLVGTSAGDKAGYFYPDITVSCTIDDWQRGNKIVRSPRLVVEVLSPSTEYRDRGKKLKAYQACPTIREIVLINQFAPRVEVYHRDEQEPATWHYTVYDEWQAVVLPAFDIHIAVANIYRGIDFDEPLTED